MKTRLMGWLLGSAAVALLLPWAAVTFVQRDAGMAVVLLLLFGINPVYSLLLGIAAGRRVKEMWSLPLIAALLFFLGMWIFFDPGEGAFFIYAGAYLVLGTAAMYLSSRLGGNRRP